MKKKQKDTFKLLNAQYGRICRSLDSLQLISVILLAGVQIVMGWALTFHFDALFYILADGIVSGLFLGAVCVAAVPSLWIRRDLERSIVKGRSLLMASVILFYAGIAGIIAAFIVGICLYA